jgi:hypothetical protein
MGDGRRVMVEVEAGDGWSDGEVHGFWWRAATETCLVVVGTCSNTLPARHMSSAPDKVHLSPGYIDVNLPLQRLLLFISNGTRT